ncbi:MAG TPA: SDR family oxidoreductase [Vitreimonas sp.]|nr:SDR family oxidoreductase [Vitreimonas sp.]
MSTLDGPVAVVMGASSGIGRATALELASRGARVVVAARRTELLDTLVDECLAMGVEAFAVDTDAADEAGVDAVADAAIGRFGRIDVWVNVASSSIYGRIDATPMSTVRRLFDVNVFGYLHGARAALRVFHQQGRGTLIDVASMLGRVAAPYQGHYAMTKHAIVALDQALRMELEDEPAIHVCTVLPASIDTPFFEHAANLTGRRPRPPGPVHSPEAVAQTIADLAERPRREVYIGSIGPMSSTLRQLFPRLYEELYARVLRREQFLDEPAPRTDGNLWAPVEAGAGTDGGWRERMPERVAPRALVAAGVAAASVAGTIALLIRRSTR